MDACLWPASIICVFFVFKQLTESPESCSVLGSRQPPLDWSQQWLESVGLLDFAVRPRRAGIHCGVDCDFYHVKSSRLSCFSVSFQLEFLLLPPSNHIDLCLRRLPVKCVCLFCFASGLDYGCESCVFICQNDKLTGPTLIYFKKFLQVQPRENICTHMFSCSQNIGLQSEHCYFFCATCL